MAQSGMSENVSSDVLDWLFRGGAFSPPATLYLAAATATPNLAGNGTIIEPNTAAQWIGYARVAIASTSASWAAASGGSIVTAAAFAFPASGGGASSPVLITDICLMDSVTYGAGRIVAKMSSPANVYVANTDVLHFVAGALFSLLG